MVDKTIFMPFYAGGGQTIKCLAECPKCTVKPSLAESQIDMDSDVADFVNKEFWNLV